MTCRSYITEQGRRRSHRKLQKCAAGQGHSENRNAGRKKPGLIPREDQYVKQAAECRYSSKKVRKIMNKGKIIQVMGPVVDVVFQDGNLPFIKDALEVENNGKKCVMEVAQHLGNNECPLS